MSSPKERFLQHKVLLVQLRSPLHC
uniref:Uncharacterized protein n=1 Tax=Rhizophora mucronata TaxID=61149 RepID=A0A2P2N1D5_RHIMU